MKNKISAKLRKQASKIVCEILKPTYFKDGVPLNELFTALESIGIIVIMEDNTRWSGFLCGSDSHCIFTLADINTKYIMNGYEMYDSYNNIGLMISWYWMEGTTGKRCEINGYIS